MQAGKSSIQFEHPPIITSAASIVGQTEGEGPLASFFDRVEPEEERSLPYGRGYAGFSGSRRNQGPGMPPRRYGRNARDGALR